MGVQLHRFADPADAVEACARDILAKLDAAGARATLAISGGSSPRRMFELFAKSGFDWNRVQLFWVDERHVPKTDSQSNFKMTNDTWLAPARAGAAGPCGQSSRPSRSSHHHRS